jgi:hypothetical protein
MKGVWESLPEYWQQIVASGIATIAMTSMGRLMWHVREVQLRRRRFFSPHLIWEGITAVCMGFLADGVIHYVGVTGKPALAMALFIAYLGPRGLEAMLIRVLETWGKKSGG